MLRKSLSGVFVFAVMIIAAAGLTLMPNPARAQYKVGDRVAMPSGNKWLDAVVIAVDPSQPFPFRVHPLGYTPYIDTSFSAQMLRPYGSIKTEPIGGIASDPWLQKVQGKATFRPTGVLPGLYQCYALSGGRLEPRPILNFTIVGGTTYRDSGGNTGSYRFDAASGQLAFQGGGLDGQSATYAQASNPPVKSEPPAITLTKSGDACDLRM